MSHRRKPNPRPLSCFSKASTTCSVNVVIIFFHLYEANVDGLYIWKPLDKSLNGLCYQSRFVNIILYDIRPVDIGQYVIDTKPVMEHVMCHESNQFLWNTRTSGGTEVYDKLNLVTSFRYSWLVYRAKLLVRVTISEKLSLWNSKCL